MNRTRRGVVVGLSLALSGCADSETASSRSVPITSTEQTAVDPPVVSLRHESEDPLVRFRATPTEGGAEDDGHYPRVRLVADGETAERMEVLADVDGRDAAHSFLAETDFDSETVYVFRRGVGACYELKPCYVSWSAGDVHVQFARQYRSPDVACSTDERHRVVTLFRIPEAIDPDDINSYGGGTRSGGCPELGRRHGRRGSE